MSGNKKLEKPLIILRRDCDEPCLSSCWCCKDENDDGDGNMVQGGEDDTRVGLNSKPLFGAKDV